MRHLVDLSRIRDNYSAVVTLYAIFILLREFYINRKFEWTMIGYEYAYSLPHVWLEAKDNTY